MMMLYASLGLTKFVVKKYLKPTNERRVEMVRQICCANDQNPRLKFAHLLQKMICCLFVIIVQVFPTL